MNCHVIEMLLSWDWCPPYVTSHTSEPEAPLQTCPFALYKGKDMCFPRDIAQLRELAWPVSQ